MRRIDSGSISISNSVSSAASRSIALSESTPRSSTKSVSSFIWSGATSNEAQASCLILLLRSLINVLISCPIRCVVGVQPVLVVDGTEVALPQIRCDQHRGRVFAPVVPGQPAQCAGDDRAGGTAEEEAVRGEPVAGPDRVRLGHVHDVVHKGRIEDL